MKKLDVNAFWDGMYRFTVPLMDVRYGNFGDHLKLLVEITAYVKQFHARLRAYIQDGNVIISAGGRKQFFPAAEYLVATKPDDLPFKVVALVPGISEDFYKECEANADWVMDNMGIPTQLSKMMCGFYPDPNQTGKLRLIVYIPEITEDDNRWYLMKSCGAYFSSLVLGERIKAEFFSSYAFEPKSKMGKEGVTEMLLYKLGGMFREG